MIERCEFGRSDIAFYDADANLNENIFTVITGKNGTGKSRLLRGIVNHFAQIEDYRRGDRLFREQSEPPVPLLYSRRPSNIIATSTSPFDKFPLDRKRERRGYYEYLGLRGLSSQNFSLGVMSKTIGALIGGISDSRHHASVMASTLNYLDYNGVVIARFALEFSRDQLSSALMYDNPLLMLKEEQRRRPMSPRVFFNFMENNDISKEFESKVLSGIEYFLSTFKRKPRLEIVIGSDGVYDLMTGAPIGSDIAALIEVGILSLRDLALHKRGVEAPFPINDASSGEQCVVLSLLGIASRIQEGSLICIDEPEICLHPEWQEKYIQRLIASFKDIKGCHFIIATHSPQIVSNLEKDNCYVVKLLEGVTVNASHLVNKSADFQLANLFERPGFGNEYIARQLLAALATVSSGKPLTDERVIDLQRLLSLRDQIEQDDPVFELMYLVSKTLEGTKK